MIKFTKLPFLLPLILLTACTSLRVTSDYDTEANFSSYKTFAFYKKGFDEAKISDLDKKRVMRAIESELLAKGFTKSNNPDILVSIFTKSREKINIQDNNWNLGWGLGWGWGWNPWMFGGFNRVNVNQYTEGTLFIDFIDKESKNLIWQGVGSGRLKMKTPEKKKERINLFVKEILDKYPPSNQ